MSGRGMEVNIPQRTKGVILIKYPHNDSIDERTERETVTSRGILLYICYPVYRLRSSDSFLTCMVLCWGLCM